MDPVRTLGSGLTVISDLLSPLQSRSLTEMRTRDDCGPERNRRNPMEDERL